MERWNELRELGLDDSEVKVYLCCLKEGGADAKTVARGANLIRTTTYGILKSLMRKGLVSVVQRDGVQLFQSASPGELINILEQKKARIASIVPDLEKLKSVSTPTYKVESFEGRNGVKTIVNDIISVPDTTVKMISVGRKWLDFSDSFTTQYYRKKKEMNVHTKTILADTREERTAIKDQKVMNSEFRFLKGVKTAGTCYIYADKVSFVTYEESSARGVIIQDAEFNRIQNLLFDNLWQRATK